MNNFEHSLMGFLGLVFTLLLTAINFNLYLALIFGLVIGLGIDYLFADRVSSRETPSWKGSAFVLLGYVAGIVIYIGLVLLITYWNYWR